MVAFAAAAAVHVVSVMESPQADLPPGNFLPDSAGNPIRMQSISGDNEQRCTDYFTQKTYFLVASHGGKNIQ